MMPAFEVCVQIYPRTTKISRFTVEALALARSAFDDVQIMDDGSWTCLWKGQRRTLLVEQIGVIVLTDETTNEGRDRQPLWGAEHRVGFTYEER